MGCSSSDGASDPATESPAVGTVELFAEVPSTTEGIALAKDAQGRTALFAGGGNSIYRIGPDREVTTIASLPDPLGIAVHPDGYLVVCGSKTGDAGTGEFPGALWKVTMDGAASLLVGEQQGSFVKPNFVVVDADRSLVFSDSSANQVYRVSADTTTVGPVTDAITFPNGMAYSPDGSVLYVASWDSKQVYKLEREGAGFGVPAPAFAVATVDGIAAMESGSLAFVTSGEGIVVGHTDGTTVQIAAAKEFALPANGVFGTGEFGEGWLYVTNLLSKRIDRVYVGERGAAR